MRYVLLACKTMQAEMEQILARRGNMFDRIDWIESGLHNVTERLKEEITAGLEEIRDVDCVVIGFGACGNALAGITAGDFEMILPKADDCISIMLGSYQRKREIMKQGETYFLTRGWLGGESNIYKEYLFTVEKYGKEMADIIYEEILGKYKHLGIIDTKAYDYERFLKETAVMAEELHLHQLPIEGDLSYLERLLTGFWDGGDFICIAPHQTIMADMFPKGK